MIVMLKLHRSIELARKKFGDGMEKLLEEE
jgi:hypothetical protein